MDKNEFWAELIIDTQNDHPDVIMKATGVDATKIFVKGEPWMSPGMKKPIPGRINKDNIWCYATNKKAVGFEDRVYWNESLSELLETLRHKKKEFRDLFKKYPACHIACYAYYYETHEWFKISASLLAELNEYGIDLVFDSYNFTKDE